MITFGINKNNDIYLNALNNCELKKDLEAMGDIYVNKSQTNTGEMKYNAIKGIDFFHTLFNHSPFPDLFQNQVQTQLQDTLETQNVTEFTPQLKDSVFSYSVKIQSSYGEVTLNG